MLKLYYSLKSAELVSRKKYIYTGNEERPLVLSFFFQTNEGLKKNQNAPRPLLILRGVVLPDYPT